MNLKLDGKTKEASGRLNDSFSPDESFGLGAVRGSGTINGVRKSGSLKNDCSGTDSAGTDGIKRDTTAGKMLQRLKLIETKCFDYIANHQKQLEAQLTNSKTHEVELKQEIAALEKDLYDLASQPDTE